MAIFTLVTQVLAHSTNMALQGNKLTFLIHMIAGIGSIIVLARSGSK